MNLNALEGLNKEQIEAVKTTEGYVRVIAGAGSGKTRTLTHRYIYLVKELGVSTSNILCVTFTNKAANEMKKRIRSMIGDMDIGYICTFHGFCKIILNEDIHAINYPDRFIIMDTEDMSALLRIVFEQLNIKHRQYTIEQAKNYISFRKRSGEYINDILNTDTLSLKKKAENSKGIEDKVFYGYIYQQKKSYLLDYDDLINFALYILKNNSLVCKKWQKRMQYIMVDEFQDVSSQNYELVSILSDYHKNLFVVGDPDQTIYSWRGASVHYILDFDKVYPNCQTIFMNTNYRSTDKILNVSNSIISKNKFRIKKELLPTKKSERQVVYNHSHTQEEEAKWIASQIKLLIQHNNNYDEIAILYRAHYVSRSIEEILMKEKIPYVIYSGIPFYERKEIKDILSYMRMIIFEDDLSFIRVVNEPKRNFGKSKMEILQEYAEQNKCTLYNALKTNIDNNFIKKSNVNSFVNLIEKYKKVYKEMNITDLLTALLVESGYEEMLRLGGEEERLDNLAEFKNSISEYELSAGEETSLEGYLNDIALLTNSDTRDDKSKVKLYTIHSAKGLEFPYVFVCGLNEGIFPSTKVKTKEELEEERRLAYVAFTRSEKVLFLSESEGYLKNNGFRFPSRFIFNIEKKLLKYNVELSTELIENSKEFIENSEANLYKDLPKAKFNKGDCISHDILGIGVIIDVDNEKKSYIIKFDNSQTERNISFDSNIDLIMKKTTESNESKEANIISNIDSNELSKEENASCKNVDQKDNDINREDLLKIDQEKQRLANYYEELLAKEKGEFELKYKKMEQEQKKNYKIEYDKKIAKEIEKISAEYDAKIKEIEINQKDVLEKEKEKLKIKYEKIIDQVRRKNNNEIIKINKEKENIEKEYKKIIEDEKKKIEDYYNKKIVEETKNIEAKYNQILNKKIESLKLDQENILALEKDKVKKIILKEINQLNMVVENNRHAIWGQDAAKRKNSIAQIDILKIILENLN